MIQNLFVPAGTVVDKVSQKMTDLTQWAVVRDHSDLSYYYKTDFNQGIRKIDLKNIDFSVDRISKIQIMDGPSYSDQTQALIAAKRKAEPEYA